MSTPEPTPGMLVTPKLRLVEPLGSGGMGAVWLADHLTLHTQVVVKFVLDKLLWSTEAVGRFAREAAAASQVKSPHVVQMLDHGVTESGLPYIVMERLEGHDLGEHLTSSGLPAREVVPIITQLARALARAHERGVVHRDIKPSNVFLCEMGGGELFVKLLDFGVAKHDAGAQPGEQTQSGAVLGSPLYMSPEQLMGEKVDFRTDLWSLGVLTFEALTGQRPFAGATMGALTMQMHAETLPRPSQKNPALPPAIDAWFFKACARDPAARFAGAKELATSLARALDEDAPRGIELERHESARDQAALADTAEASSGENLRERLGVRSGRPSAGSAPPQVSATGAGLSSTGGIGKREGGWRPVVLLTVAAVIGVAIVGARTIRGRAEDAPPGLAIGATAPTTALRTVSTAESSPETPGLPGAPPLAQLATTAMARQRTGTASTAAPVPSSAPVAVAPKHRPLSLSPSASPRSAASVSAPSASGHAPLPAASAVTSTRPTGSDDDIR